MGVDLMIEGMARGDVFSFLGFCNFQCQEKSFNIDQSISQRIATIDSLGETVIFGVSAVLYCDLKKKLSL